MGVDISLWREADHPRDRLGRFRSKWNIDGPGKELLDSILDGFNARQFSSPQEAQRYLSQRFHGYTPEQNKAMREYLHNFKAMDAEMYAGKKSPESEAIKSMMRPSPDDLILTQSMGPASFGLDGPSLPVIEEVTGKLLNNKSFGNFWLGGGANNGGITMHLLAPRGTKIAHPGGAEVMLDDDHKIRVTRVEEDGKGGYRLYAVAVPGDGKGGDSEGRSAVQAVREGFKEGNAEAAQTPGTPQAMEKLPDVQPKAIPERLPPRGSSGDPGPAPERVVVPDHNASQPGHEANGRASWVSDRGEPITIGPGRGPGEIGVWEGKNLVANAPDMELLPQIAANYPEVARWARANKRLSGGRLAESAKRAADHAREVRGGNDEHKEPDLLPSEKQAKKAAKKATPAERLATVTPLKKRAEPSAPAKAPEKPATVTPIRKKTGLGARPDDAVEARPLHPTHTQGPKELREERIKRLGDRAQRGGRGEVTSLDEKRAQKAAPESKATPGAPATVTPIGKAAPKPPAPVKKAGPVKRVPKGQFKAADVSAKLDAAQGRDEAKQALEGLTVAQLKEVAAEQKMPLRSSRMTKAQLVDDLANFGPGSRADSKAIRQAFEEERAARAAKKAEPPRPPVKTAPGVPDILDARMRRAPGEEGKNQARNVPKGERDVTSLEERRAKLAAKKAAKAVPAAEKPEPEKPEPVKKLAKKAPTKVAAPDREQRAERRAAEKKAAPSKATEAARKKAEITNAREKAQREKDAAAGLELTEAWLERAGLKESDLSDHERAGMRLMGEKVAAKEISRPEAMRRLKQDDPDSNLSRIARAITARKALPAKKVAKAAPAKVAPIKKATRATPAVTTRVGTRSLQPGDKVYAQEGDGGKLFPTTRRTGVKTITIDSVKPATKTGPARSQRARQRYEVTGRDENGNEVSLGSHDPSQRWSKLEGEAPSAPEPAKAAPAKKATKTAAKAAKAATPEAKPEAPKAPTKTAKRAAKAKTLGDRLKDEDPDTFRTDLAEKMKAAGIDVGPLEGKTGEEIFDDALGKVIRKALAENPNLTPDLRERVAKAVLKDAGPDLRGADAPGEAPSAPLKKVAKAAKKVAPPAPEPKKATTPEADEKAAKKARADAVAADLTRKMEALKEKQAAREAASKAAPKPAPAEAPKLKDLDADQLQTLRHISAMDITREGGWAQRDDLPPKYSKHLDALAEAGWLEKASTPDGDRFRINKTSAGGRGKPSNPDVLEGDILPPVKPAESRLHVDKLKNGSVIDVQGDGKGGFGEVPKDAPESDPKRRRLIVQRVEKLDADGKPTKAAMAPRTRIIGHDADTGERMEAEVGTGSTWPYHSTPDTGATPDIEGELVEPKKAVTAAKKATPGAPEAEARKADTIADQTEEHLDAAARSVERSAGNGGSERAITTLARAPMKKLRLMPDADGKAYTWKREGKPDVRITPDANPTDADPEIRAARKMAHLAVGQEAIGKSDDSPAEKVRKMRELRESIGKDAPASKMGRLHREATSADEAKKAAERDAEIDKIASEPTPSTPLERGKYFSRLAGASGAGEQNTTQGADIRALARQEFRDGVDPGLISRTMQSRADDLAKQHLDADHLIIGDSDNITPDVVRERQREDVMSLKRIANALMRHKLKNVKARSAPEPGKPAPAKAVKKATKAAPAGPEKLSGSQLKDRLKPGDAIEIDGERDGVRTISPEGVVTTWQGRKITPWGGHEVSKIPDETPAPAKAVKKAAKAAPAAKPSARQIREKLKEAKTPEEGREHLKGLTKQELVDVLNEDSTKKGTKVSDGTRQFLEDQAVRRYTTGRLEHEAYVGLGDRPGRARPVSSTPGDASRAAREADNFPGGKYKSNVEEIMSSNLSNEEKAKKLRRIAESALAVAGMRQANSDNKSPGGRARLASAKDDIERADILHRIADALDPPKVK